MAKKRILVQAGHLAPREPGFEGGTGTNGEQELVKAIRDRLVAILRKDGRFEAIPVPGDIPNGIRVDAALYLHGDGSSNPGASGYCFGYPDHPTNKRLADMIAVEFNKIPGHPPHGRDNYTGGLRGYYGYSRVNTPGPEVLVEHGFLTNPAERRWLYAHVDELAQAEYKALLRFFGMQPAKTKTFKWAYRVVESDGRITQGKSNYPQLSFVRQAARQPKRITYERL